MVRTAALFDTNILVDYLKAIPSARVECERYDDRAISIVTWMEIMAGSTKENETDLREFLQNFVTLPLTQEIAEQTVAVRRSMKIKLPDAVIKATAEKSARLLITRNTRDFPPETPGVRIPYSVGR